MALDPSSLLWATYSCVTLKHVDEIERRNVTLSLPVDLLKSAKLLAVERETSLSGLLREALQALVTTRDYYSQAMEEELLLMEEGLPCGTRGQASWSRDELYER